MLRRFVRWFPSPPPTVHYDGAQSNGDGEHGGEGEGTHGDGVTARASHDVSPRRTFFPDPRHVPGIAETWCRLCLRRRGGDESDRDDPDPETSADEK